MYTFPCRLPARAPLASALLTAFALTSFGPAAIAGNTTLQVTDCSDGPGSGTLRHVVALAASTDEIDASACVNSTITLSGGEIAMPQASLTVFGPADGSLTISGNHNSRVFNHSGNSLLALRDLTLTAGSVAVTGSDSGGCVKSASSVTLQRVTVSGCSLSSSGDSARVHGGGVQAAGTITLDHSVITGNTVNATTATNKGYALGGGVDAMVVNAQASTIDGNSASIGNTNPFSRANGGGIYAQQLTLDASTLSGNHAIYGGAVYVKALGTATLTSSTLSANTGKRGGALFTRSALSATSSQFLHNSSTGVGAVYANANVTFTGSTIAGNASSGKGGGVYTKNDATLTNSTVAGNTSTSNGAGVCATNATLSFSTVYGNQMTGSGKGAGLYVTGNTTVTSSIITSNIATGGEDDINAGTPIAVAGDTDIIGPSGGVTLPAGTANCDAKLGPFAKFGGATKVLPLLTGSCAIDMASATPTVSVDQRGSPRPVQVSGGLNADIGAFEKQSATDPEYIFIDSFGDRF
jgi:hypothetical protein